MQVNCSKCSKPIALTDVIQLSAGHLVHVDCKRVRTLTAEERSLVFVYCSAHAVAQCLSCGLSFRFGELAADTLGGGRTNLCPRCRKDLTENVRGHLYGCAMLPSEVRMKAQAVREAAKQLVKRSQEAIDRADVVIREAEVLLFERQQALRAAMAATHGVRAHRRGGWQRLAAAQD
jgi:hypothetical protein